MQRGRTVAFLGAPSSAANSLGCNEEGRKSGLAEDRVKSLVRLWRQSRPLKRDLAVSILLDVSRSTESAVSGCHSHNMTDVGHSYP